jgi:hypothetical protein
MTLEEGKKEGMDRGISDAAKSYDSNFGAYHLRDFNDFFGKDNFR